MNKMVLKNNKENEQNGANIQILVLNSDEKEEKNQTLKSSTDLLSNEGIILPRKSWLWPNIQHSSFTIFEPKTREKKHFDNDKDNISSEESEKRIHKCCLMTGALMNLLILILVLSLHILSLDLDIMIIVPKIGRDKYCKHKTYTSLSMMVQVFLFQSGNNLN